MSVNLGMAGKANVVIVIFDALRARNLSTYGYSLETDPYVKRLSKEGLVFENFYATVDQTDPSITTIMSGRHPLTHGILRHGAEVTRKYLLVYKMTGTLLLSEILRREGYRTIAVDWIGRWHRRGYDVYGEPDKLAEHSSQPKLLLKYPKARRLLEEVLIHSPSILYPHLYGFFKRVGVFWGKNAPSYFNIALDLVRETVKEGKHFLLLIHLWDTHTPLNKIPRYFLEKFKPREKGETVEEMAKRIKNPLWRKAVLEYHLKGIKYVGEVEPRYNAAISYVDHYLKEFIEGLKELNIYDETYIVLTADHGDNLVRNGVFIGHGGLYQDVLKVPLIIVGPEVPRGVRVRHLAQHVDLLPTVLSLLGVKTNYSHDGLNLVELARGEVEPRESILAVSSTANRRYAIVKEDYKLVYSPTLEDAMDKYSGIWLNSVIELYNIKRDPYEKENLAPVEPAIVKELERELGRLVETYMRKRRLLITRKLSLRRGKT